MNNYYNFTFSIHRKEGYYITQSLDFPEVKSRYKNLEYTLLAGVTCLNLYLEDLIEDSLPIPLPGNFEQDPDVQYFKIKISLDPTERIEEVDQIHFKFENKSDIITWFENEENESFIYDNPPSIWLELYLYDGGCIQALYLENDKLYEFRSIRDRAPFVDPEAVQEYLGRELTSLDCVGLWNALKEPWDNLKFTHLASHIAYQRESSETREYNIRLRSWSKKKELEFDPQNTI